jgi:tripartite-type tricarboxylate transporter receptor subunit TctC
LPYDPIRDLEPITQVASVPSVLIVNPSLAVATVADLIGLALANPGQLGFGSAGPGTSSHLAGELLKSMAKIDVVHVPYKGGGPMMGDLVAGRVSFVIEPLPVALPYLKSGRVRGIAVSTARRLTVLPDLPPISETLPGYDVTGWFGILAPAGTPPEVVARVNGELVRLLRSQEMRERLAGLGAEPVGDSPGEFAAHIRREIQRWGELVRASGAKAQ